MYETVALIGLATTILPVLLYNTREIIRVKDKVDLIYKHVNIRLSWAANGYNNKGGQKHGMEDKKIRGRNGL